MLGHTFYHSLIRKYVILFGNLFNEIDVRKIDNSGNVIETKRVPIYYGPKHKYINREEENPEFKKSIALSTPRLAFEITSFSYDPSRQRQVNNKIVSKDKSNFSYDVVPYNFNFSLYAYVHNHNEALQIVEQILPFFKPDLNVSMHLSPDFNLLKDIQIKFDTPDFKDNYEGVYTEKREIIYELKFTLSAWLLGPLYKGGLIKKVIIDYHIDNNPSRIIRTTAQPRTNYRW